MKLPAGMVLPAWLNLGIAPPPPRSANAYSPRATLLPVLAIGDVFDSWGGTEPLVLSTFFLAPAALTDSPLVSPPQSQTLMPNPYNSAQW